jgi:YbgC/YbaW family acyl-CoA thioester hydrolase
MKDSKKQPMKQTSTSTEPIPADYKFWIPIRVRIADINYGNHVGYQQFFSYFQDARIAYLDQFGFSERNIAGFSMVVAEAHCRYKRELLFGNDIRIHCRVTEIKTNSFLMTYLVEREGLICAIGSTTNLCFDPLRKKVVPLPPAFIMTIKAFEG